MSFSAPTGLNLAAMSFPRERRQAAVVPIPPRILATTPALPDREDGRCSLAVRASERVDRNPRYGSKCRDFYDWTQQDPARSIIVSLLRGSAPLGQRKVTQ
jgi:hypothetical protein